MIEQRDLILVPFPFSDQSGRKVRPVIVISNNKFNQNSEDILVAGVTSNISKEKYNILLKSKDLEQGSLATECCVKCENIVKIDKEIVIRKIGKIKKEIFDLIIKMISDIISKD